MGLELAYVLGAAVLLVALTYGIRASRTRNRANDKVVDAAVRAQYAQGDSYNPQEFERKLVKEDP